MSPTKLIATYARVSTARQEEEQTIKTQDVVLKDEAVRRNYTIVKEYTDDGWSGDTLARPGLDQLRAEAKSKLFDAVLVYDPDRLARRYSYQELIMDELREAGIEVIFVTIAAPKNSEDKILYGVRGLFAEYERAKISERFRLGKVRKVKEGHLLVSTPLYGYDYIPKQEKRPGYYMINEREAAVVRMMFSWVADEGLTQRKIVRRLQEMNIKPRKSGRGVWNTSTLSTLFNNKAYIGEAHWGSSYATVPVNPLSKEKYRKNKKSSRRIRPVEEWYSIPVPPIIDKDLFLRARKQIETNYAISQRNTKNEYLLGKKIWCPCGNRRAGEGPQKGKHLYYRCNNRVLNFPLPPTCSEKGVNARIADTMVWDFVYNLMTSPELLREQMGRRKDDRKKVRENPAGDIEAIKREIDKLKISEERYNKAYGAGVFTMEKLSEYVNPLREQISSLNSQITKIQEGKNQIHDSVFPGDQEIEAFARNSEKTLQNMSFQAKREIVLKVIERVVGNKNGLQVCGNIPIPVISNDAFYSNDRNRQVTIRHFASENHKSIPFEFRIDL